MKKILFVLLLILSSDGFAYFYYAGKVYNDCTEDKNSFAYHQNTAFCQGYISAVVDHASRTTSAKRACIPENVSVEQLIKIFVKHIDKNPENMRLDASDIIEHSVYLAFKCD